MIENIKVIIGQKIWYGNCATTESEIQKGLSNLKYISPMSCMLFDLGYTTQVQVTTKDMKFPIDIIFISDNNKVNAVYRQLKPGYIFTSPSCRYFLESNQNETIGVYEGDLVKIESFEEEDEF